MTDADHIERPQHDSFQRRKDRTKLNGLSIANDKFYQLTDLISCLPTDIINIPEHRMITLVDIDKLYSVD